MADEKKDRRHILKRKTTWGLILFALAKTMVFFPPTLPFAPIVETAGILLTGGGLASRISRASEDK